MLTPLPSYATPSRKSWISLAINPFELVSRQSIGFMSALVLILMSIGGFLANTQFPGLFDCLRNSAFEGAKATPSIFYIGFQILLSTAVLALITFISEALANKRKPRHVLATFFTFLFSRYPYLILVGSLAALESQQPNFLEELKAAPEIPATWVLGFTLLVSTCVIWQGLTYYYAFRHQTGMKGMRLFIGFAVTVILSQTIANILLLNIF